MNLTASQCMQWMPLHLEAPQYILQLVGQRQRMSLHLGGTAIHLAIGREQMQAVKESIIQRRSNLQSEISVLAGKQSNKRCTRIFNFPRSTLRERKIRYLLLANRKQYWSWVLQQCQPTKGKISKWQVEIWYWSNQKNNQTNHQLC